jgi:chaperonin GroES
LTHPTCCNPLKFNKTTLFIAGTPIACSAQQISANYFYFNNYMEVFIMNVKPLEDRILLKPMEAEQKTAGGIIIPDNAKEKPQKGEVVAVGPGKTSDKGAKIEMTLKKGDKVLYGKYSGTEISVDGQDYLILRESDVLAIL